MCPIPATIARDERDRERLEALRLGRFDVFKEIFDSYSIRLVRFAAMSVDLATAEELVQDVMMSLWLYREQLDIQTTLSSYLYSSVRNRVVNWCKRDKMVRTKVEITADTQRLWRGSDPLSPERQVIVEERMVEIYKAIDNLGELQRSVITLRWEEQMSYEEIAKVLSISLQAAKQNGSRAHRAIRQALEDGSDED